jgi:glycosyltransferase involved in cell wall biosynthesis
VGPATGDERPRDFPALARARIALVHDWLTGMRGGEKVLDLLVGRLPHADVFTMVHVPGSVSARLEARRPARAFVSALPLAAKAYRHFLPLFPAAVEQFDLDDYDLVISTSHCAVKSAVHPGRARHLCYCFTPMRYAWDQFDAYFGPGRVGRWSHAMRPVLAHLGRWDASTAHRPDRYVAISQYVARRIARYYNRRSAVVYPPTDTVFFTPGEPGGRGYGLVVSALVPYKRVEVAIEACRLAGLPVKVVGTGPESEALANGAGPDVEFLGWASNEEIRALYRDARAVLLPGEEDFGIVPIEAMACGTPVVALAAGGALETVVDGVTGRLVRSAEPAAFADALRDLPDFDRTLLRAHAERFSPDRFATTFLEVAEDLLMAPAADARW